jgi:PhoPQ-activated pathogenicity-related protein
MNPAARADAFSQASAPAHHGHSPYANAWPDYRERQSRIPLLYWPFETVQIGDVEKRSFLLVSQKWPESGDATRWTHQVDVYIPSTEKSGDVLLVMNNGIVRPSGQVSPSTDFTQSDLLDIADSAHMIVVSVSDVPNEYLQLPGDSQALKEDDLVAATWRHFLDDPAHNRTLPLHVPMAEAGVRAMDLVQRELGTLRARSFIVTGLSKRAWAAWLLAIGDPRVAAIVPYVMGMHFQPLMSSINRNYGGGWPIALSPYYNAGVLGRYQQPVFGDLMAVDDPYAYLSTPYAWRLGIPKYIVNASGDDFFPPDVSRLYTADLPGETSERVIANSSHYGIKQHVHDTLIPVLRRWTQRQSLPTVRAKLWVDGDRLRLEAEASGSPQSATLWVAVNPDARDFRYACDVHYVPMPATMDHGNVVATFEKPKVGWSAAFVELAYADGFTATTPVYVYPDNVYPSSPPADKGGACKAIADTRKQP